MVDTGCDLVFINNKTNYMVGMVKATVTCLSLEEVAQAYLQIDNTSEGRSKLYPMTPEHRQKG